MNLPLLWNRWCAGTAPEDYKDPRKFITRTCFTRVVTEHRIWDVIELVEWSGGKPGVVSGRDFIHSTGLGVKSNLNYVCAFFLFDPLM